MKALRSLLYQLASLLGDIIAVCKGPRAIIARAARKRATRMASRLINKSIK